MSEAVFMPEIILYKFINTVFDIIQEDYNNNPLEDTMLYSIFNQDFDGETINIETFNYLEQAKRIFIERRPQVNVGYEMEVTDMGSIHILLPNESGKPMNVGGSENYQEYLLNESETHSKPVFTQGFNSNFNIMITSENTLEVLLIYNLLKASFISLYQHLELKGFQNVKIGGQDVNFQSDLIPPHIFHRSLTLTFEYDTNIPYFFYTKIIKKYVVRGEPIVDNE